MSISQEFLDLCRAQLKLLVQGLDLSFGIVYLMAEGSFDDGTPTLTPVAAHPETAVTRDVTLLLPESSTTTEVQPEDRVIRADAASGEADSRYLKYSSLRQSDPPEQSLQPIDVTGDSPAADRITGSEISFPDSPYSDSLSPGVPLADALASEALSPDAPPTDALSEASLDLLQEASLVAEVESDDGSGSVYIDPVAQLEQANRGRVIIPLTYSDVVLGLLVIDRVNQAWTTSEQHQIEQVAHTLAAGCVIDRRTHWLDQRLRQQHLAYEAFHQQQDTMVDTLLHQLRNPLTAVQTFGKLLLRRTQAGDANRTAVEGIVRESDRIRLLLEKFNQLLAPMPPTLPPGNPEPATPTSVSSGAVELPGNTGNPTDVSTRPVSASQILMGDTLERSFLDLNKVLEPLMLTTVTIAQERNIDIHRDQPEPSRVIADPKALREVLTNLLDNALKYTPPGGYVEVRTGLTGPAVDNPSMQTMVIADTGPGIPLEDQRHLFERHFRGVQAAGDIPGTGLGLAIAKDLMQQMNGTLSVHSPAANSHLLSQRYPSDCEAGTAVVIQLPAA